MSRKHTIEHEALRQAALNQNQKTYLGHACKHGHEGRRYTINKCCVDCTPKTRPRTERTIQRLQVKEALGRDHRKRLLSSAKRRAAESGREFNIGLEDIVIPEVCPVLKIPMTSPSLDRVDNDKGYVVGNVQVISLRANTLKNNGTIAELKAIIRYMERHQKDVD